MGIYEILDEDNAVRIPHSRISTDVDFCAKIFLAIIYVTKYL